MGFCYYKYLCVILLLCKNELWIVFLPKLQNTNITWKEWNKITNLIDFLFMDKNNDTENENIILFTKKLLILILYEKFTIEIYISCNISTIQSS